MGTMVQHCLAPCYCRFVAEDDPAFHASQQQPINWQDMSDSDDEVESKEGGESGYEEGSEPESSGDDVDAKSSSPPPGGKKD